MWSSGCPVVENVVVLMMLALSVRDYCLAECGGWELRASHLHLPQLSSCGDTGTLFSCFWSFSSWWLLLSMCSRCFLCVFRLLSVVSCFIWQEGAILVFLPGWDNISNLNDLLMAQQMFRSGGYMHIWKYIVYMVDQNKWIFFVNGLSKNTCVCYTNIGWLLINQENMIIIKILIKVVCCVVWCRKPSLLIEQPYKQETSCV